MPHINLQKSGKEKKINNNNKRPPSRKKTTRAICPCAVGRAGCAHPAVGRGAVRSKGSGSPPRKSAAVGSRGRERNKNWAGPATLCPEASPTPPGRSRRHGSVPACAPKPRSAGAAPRRARRRRGPVRPPAGPGGGSG